jgi:hypothetical protein
METHVKVLGILNILCGAVGLTFALFFVVVLGGVSALIAADGDPDAATAISILGATGAFTVALITILSLPGIVIGWGLYRQRAWSRIAGIVLSVLSLVAFPIGTLLGVYGLWVLFSKDTERVFAPAALS